MIYMYIVHDGESTQMDKHGYIFPTMNVATLCHTNRVSYYARYLGFTL